MNIVCTFDDNYLPHCATMLTTLRNANPDHYFHVSLVNSGKNVGEACKLYTYLSSIMDIVSLIQFDDRIFSHLPLSGHFTAATYSRLALPSILPAEFTRVLYLDIDIAVIGDLEKLYETDMKGFPLAAAPNDDELQGSRRLYLEPSSGYFNSGVLLIDLPSLRQENLVEKASAFMQNYPERIAYADQDVLNHLYQASWLRLDQHWNYQTGSLLHDIYSASPTQVKPSIVHFTGDRNFKPWHYKCVNPYSKIFQEAKSLTPWAKAPLTGVPPSLGFKIKSRLKKVLTS